MVLDLLDAAACQGDPDAADEPISHQLHNPRLPAHIADLDQQVLQLAPLQRIKEYLPRARVGSAQQEHLHVDENQCHGSTSAAVEGGGNEIKLKLLHGAVCAIIRNQREHTLMHTLACIIHVHCETPDANAGGVSPIGLQVHMSVSRAT